MKEVLGLLFFIVVVIAGLLAVLSLAINFLLFLITPLGLKVMVSIAVIAAILSMFLLLTD